jgi:hypothetical protein
VNKGLMNCRRRSPSKKDEIYNVDAVTINTQVRRSGKH